ncbi:hypothetical protein [Sphingomonas sp. Leaf4]|uniref:hypothetical protein n=1 Tax=Sphingomonas sp. Leaf4 TaxID=2876553 RepID=UPI001E4A1D30|nr:hypothetical protein [Sphingomonas sp. Leaf4]
MALFASLVFAIAFFIAIGAIVGTILPARGRIIDLLRQGSGQTMVDPLPSVRLTSRRGVIRQRAVTPAAVRLRAAA